MRRIEPVCLFVEGKKVRIKTVSFTVSTGVGQEHTGTVVAYHPSSESFLELDTGELINIKYIVSIDILK